MLLSMEGGRSWSTTEILTTAFVVAFLAGVITFLILGLFEATIPVNVPALYVSAIVFLVMFLLVFVPASVARYVRWTDEVTPTHSDSPSPPQEVGDPGPHPSVKDDRSV